MLLCRLTAIILNTAAPAARRDGVRCCQRCDAVQAVFLAEDTTQRRCRPETERPFVVHGPPSRAGHHGCGLSREVASDPPQRSRS